MNILANEIKRLREENNLTQAELAKSLGVDQTFVSKIERGLSVRFGADTLYRLCDTLKVGCDHFRPFVLAEVAAAVPGPKTAPNGSAAKRGK